jgi:hypothetical protein
MPTLTLVEIVGEPREWTAKNGPVAGQLFNSYKVKDDAGTIFEINRKASSPPPDLGTADYEITPPKEGTSFPPKIKKVGTWNGGNQSRSKDDSPGPEFWAAKDKRIARAGVLQAVITGSDFGELSLNDAQGIRATVKWWNEIADAVLASLDARTPHPNGDAQDFRREAQGTPTQRDAASANASGNPATPQRKAATSKRLRAIGIADPDTQRQIVHAFAGDPVSVAGLDAVDAAVANRDYSLLFDEHGIPRPPDLPDTQDLVPAHDDSGTIL